MIRFALVLAMLAGCADLADVERLRCGNGLIEARAGEDCDGLPPGSTLTCGLPGTPTACRYTCASGGCPADWTCGADLICRIGQGRLAPPWSREFEGQRMATGDIDGDGYDDVVIQSSAGLTVAHGDGAAALGEVRTHRLAPTVVGPVVGDIDGDGRDDVLAYGRQGPLFYRGRADRRLVPVATPQAEPAGEPVFAAGVRALPPYDEDQLLVLRQTADGLRGELDGRPLEAYAIDLLDEGAPLVRAAVGDLDGDGGDELALAVERGDRVAVVRPVCGAESCVLAPVRSIGTPGAQRLAGGTFFGDLDADGDLDLVVPLDGLVRYAASLNEPGGELGALTPAPGLATTGMPPIIEPFGLTPVLHAVVDVVGDARADIVDSVGVYRSVEGPLPWARYAGPLGDDRPAIRVVPADLDGDGRAELAAIYDDGLILSRFDEAGQLVLSVFGLSSIDEIVAADFDGDGIDEMIGRQAGGDMLFAVDDDRLEPIVQFERAPTRLVALTRDDNGVVVRPDTLRALGDGVVYALSGQTLGPPLPLLGLPGRAHFAVIGRLVDDAPGAVFAHALLDGSTALHGLPGAALGSAGPVPLTDECAMAARSPALARVADLDRDGRHEVLELSRGLIEGEAPFTVPGSPGQGQPDAFAERPLQLRQIDVIDGAATCRFADVLTSALTPVELEVLDLDGDGHDDVVALLVDGAATPGSGRRPGESALVVWLTGGRGVPGRGRVVPLEQPTLAAASMRLGRRHALVLATADTLQAVHWRDDAPVFEPIGDAPGGVQALAAADIDGDGLDDLVIKSVGAVLIRRQAACTALDDWERRCTRAAR